MIYYHTVGLQLVLEVAHQIFVLTMLVTEEKGMSIAEKDPEPGSSTPTYDLPFCLETTSMFTLLKYIQK